MKKIIYYYKNYLIFIGILLFACGMYIKSKNIDSESAYMECSLQYNDPDKAEACHTLKIRKLFDLQDKQSLAFYAVGISLFGVGLYSSFKK